VETSLHVDRARLHRGFNERALHEETLRVLRAEGEKTLKTARGSPAIHHRTRGGRKGPPVKGSLVQLTLACAALALLLSPGCGRREELQLAVPSVSRTLLTDRPLTVGDPIDVALIIYHGRDEKLFYPKDDKDFAPFTLRETSVKAKRLRGGITRTLVIHTLTIFSTGTYRLEPAEVAVGNTILKTDPLEIRILSVLPQDTPDPPLKDIVPPYKPRVRTMFVLLMGGAVAAGAVLLHYLRRLLMNRRKVRRELAMEVKEVDPYLFAIQALESLKQEHAERKAGVKEAYSTISSALRFFVGRIAGIDALRMTTSEIGRMIKRGRAIREKAVELPSARFPSDRIIGVLRKSDLVKFAKATPAPETVTEDIEETARIVEEVHASMARVAQAPEGSAPGGGTA
jgi:hypothetical protein